MKIKVTQENHYVVETRGIKKGDVLTVLSFGQAEQAKRGKAYLVDGRKAGSAPIVIYEDECEIVAERSKRAINNPTTPF